MAYHLFRTGLSCIAAVAGVIGLAQPVKAETLNLICFASAEQNQKKIYNVFWIDLNNNVVTIGNASGTAAAPDELKVESVSRTVPVVVSPGAFTFEMQGKPESIDKKTGTYTSASGKQERCWKGEMPLPG